eukprot:Protomagalhaensia_wolfi_Nauph_80__538@NODE_1302_length_1599_cov_140_564103_g1005_i0_p3_GENE_NODE_1302_length_1599_cov_140_564103_g1005_i0NODE_1302_length_1599_cov_140_564103_g1005_i0_p3_ORF_typecomplete_len108_score10_65Integrin_beta/PF00362_18/0_2_NODE_1302_length_1599_cov_140_564103_g1005_i010981421
MGFRYTGNALLINRPWKTNKSLIRSTYLQHPTPENGFYSDVCVSLSTDLDTILDGYNKYSPYGGGDPPECQFVALLAASQLPFDWNPFASHRRSATLRFGWLHYHES